MCTCTDASDSAGRAVAQHELSGIFLGDTILCSIIYGKLSIKKLYNSISAVSVDYRHVCVNSYFHTLNSD